MTDDIITVPAIPDAALDDRLAFVGTSGSGKTYAAGTAVERLLARRARVVIIDPLDVWFGLRLCANGRTPSPFPVVIFGGAHGDLPLNEYAGKLLGETVAGMAESSIVSLGGLATKSAERRFMLAFLDALYRKASGEPVHLVFDEADLWAPQKSSEPALQSLMEQIVRRGRVKGFIPWLITQRPAVLSKDVLSQADGLVAMKLTSSQDRAALGAWIEGQADAAEKNRMLARLPQMARGHGVVWIPGRGALDEVAFGRKATFDSSRTPKRGERREATALTPIDLGALQDRLATAEADVKANDPAALRRRIAELEAAQGPDPAALRAEYDRGHAAGYDKGRQEMKALHAHVAFVADAIGGKVDELRQITAKDLPATVPADAPIPAPVARPAPIPARRPTGDGKLSKAERAVLTVLAQYPQGRAKTQIALLTGYSHKGGGFNNSLSSLRSKGWIEGRGDPITITADGLAALGDYEPLPQGRALVDYWMGQLGKAERAVLETAVAHYPTPLSKDQVAQIAGYEPSGGGFNNALSRLRSLELISGRGEIKAADTFFE